MKTNTLLKILCVFLANASLAVAQDPQIEYFPTTRSRIQQLNQFTDVFISSPVDNQILGDVSGLFPGTGTITVNRYFEFDPTLYTYGYYRQISLVDAATTIMFQGERMFCKWAEFQDKLV